MAAQADLDGRPAIEAAEHELRDRVDQDRDPEQHETELKQGAEIEIACRLRELIGDDAREGVTGRKKRGADFRPVADDHGDGHGLPKRPAEAEHGRAEQAAAGIADDGDADRLPMGRAERIGRLALQVGNRAQDLAGDGGDDRQDHDREHDAARQHADPVDLPLENRQEAEPALQPGKEMIAQPGDHHEDAPQSENHARHGREHLRLPS